MATPESRMCPTCRLYSPGIVDRCECGFNFISHRQEPLHTSPEATLATLTKRAQQAAERARRNKWLVVLIVVVPGLVQSLGRALSSGEQDSSGALALAGTIIVATVGLVGVSQLRWLMAKRAGGPYVVVWLRRFSRRRGAIRWQRQAIEDALRGCATLLTLADSNVPADHAYTVYRLKWFAVPAVFLAICGGLGLAILTLLVMMGSFTTSTAWGVASVTALALVVLPFIRPGLRAFRRLGHARAEQDPVAALTRVLEPIRLGRSFGSAIVHCDDQSWRPAVAEALRRANAVVMDLQEWSEHLAWELEQAHSILGPSKMVVVYDQASEGPLRAQLERLRRSRAVHLVSATTLPGEQNFWIETESAKRQRKAFRDVLFSAIAARPDGSPLKGRGTVPDKGFKPH